MKKSILITTLFAVLCLFGIAEAGDMNKKYAKPANEELKKKLNPLQYQVTQQCGT